jgi:hypothetical protein
MQRATQQNKSKTLLSFEAKYIHDNDCWIWIAGTTNAGKPVFNYNNNAHRAHRFAYEAWIGPIHNHSLIHNCNNNLCVNPFHLSKIPTAKITRKSLSKQELQPFRTNNIIPNDYKLIHTIPSISQYKQKVPFIWTKLTSTFVSIIQTKPNNFYQVDNWRKNITITPIIINNMNTTRQTQIGYNIQYTKVADLSQNTINTIIKYWTFDKPLSIFMAIHNLPSPPWHFQPNINTLSVLGPIFFFNNNYTNKKTKTILALNNRVNKSTIKPIRADFTEFVGLEEENKV